MNKKKAFYVSLMVIILISSLSLCIYFYIENRRIREELRNLQLRLASEYADNIYRDLYHFLSAFYYHMADLTTYLARGFPAEVNTYILNMKCNILESVALKNLGMICQCMYGLYSIAHHGGIIFFDWTDYQMVHNVIYDVLWQIRYARESQVGKTDEEFISGTLTFLWELYHLVGADLAVFPENSKLGQLAWCFHILYHYWNEELAGIKYSVPIQTILGWILGNATALHQDIVQWDKYHPSF